MKPTARISEIFESFQGEGVYAGARQVFVRFFGCNLSCSFCDTPRSSFTEYDADGLWREVAGFSPQPVRLRRTGGIPWPVGQDRPPHGRNPEKPGVTGVSPWGSTGFHSLSLTGGEPLCQAEFLRVFLAGAPARGVKVYLETNGVLVPALTQVIGLVDIVAMDIKLPSSTGLGAFWAEHEEFLKIALRREVFVKLIIGRATVAEDAQAAARLVSRVAASVPVVLQPSWSDRGEELSEKMAAFKEVFAAAGVPDVRVLPQAHKLAGMR